MSATEIRRKLFDYIREADEKKVKAIYTIVENEIERDADIWTEEFLKELNKRTADFESEKVKSYTWKEVRARAKEYAKTKNV